MLEALIFSSLFGGGMFTWGYFYKDDLECKSINMQVPTEYIKPHAVTDCLEKGNFTCAIKIQKPRYIVPENEYKKLNNYVKGMRTYLQECEMVVDRYNEDRYVE